MDLLTAFRLLLVAFIATAFLSGLLAVFRKKLMSSEKIDVLDQKAQELANDQA